MKYRSKAADVTSQPSSSRTLPRNAFSDQQPDMQLPTAAMMQQLPENTLAVGSSNGRRMTERSKTLGPGFMRGHGSGQQQQQRVHHYQPDQDAVIASRSGHKLNFFLFPFCKKIIDLPGGQINDPSSGNTILCSSYQQLPCLRLGPLKGFLS